MRFLTAVEVADLLSVTESTIRNWVRDEKIPYIRIGGTLRFCFDDVMKAGRPSLKVSTGGRCSYEKVFNSYKGNKKLKRMGIST